MSTLFIWLLILFIVIFLIIIIVGVIYYAVGRNKQLNSDCTTQIDCDPNLVCSISGPSDLKTVCKAGLNQMCSTNSDCAFGLNCGGSGKCVAAGISPPPQSLSNRLLSGGPSPLHRLTMPRNPGWFGLPTSTSGKHPVNTVVEDTGTVSSVCTIVGGNLTCRPRVGENLYSSPIVDVCGYSEFLIFLLQNGNLIVEENGDKSYRVTSNILMKSITNYRGYLYGLSVHGQLYYLPNDYLRKLHWNWKKDVIEVRSTHMSASTDGDGLWLQNENDGYLYDRDRQLFEEVSPIEGIRVMGNSIDQFLVLLNDCAHLVPNRKIIENVKYAIYDDNNQVITLEKGNKDFSKIVIANYRPYYIRG